MIMEKNECEYFFEKQDFDEQISRLLKTFSVDIQNGFLPSIDPLSQLSLSSKFANWELIMKDLSSYLHAKIFRSKILLDLEIIHIEDDDLLDEREYQRALLVLSMLSHAFVWGEKPISDYIPSCLAIPWTELCQRTCRLPVLTHSLMVLYNWKRFDIEKPIELGNLAIINGFLGGIDEANFYLVTVELEGRGGKALKHMLKAQYFAKNENIKEFIEELKQIEIIQKTMLNSLSKIFQDVDPYIFYNRIRHFLSGWKDNPLLPNGLIYQGVSQIPTFLYGASAAQSSLIVAFDIFFDVKHQSQQTVQFIDEMKFYMPPKHRQFLQFLDKNKFSINHLKEKVELLNDKQLLDELISTYNNSLDQLILFRNKHIQIVTVFILSQTQKKQSNDDDDDDESSTRGTGGTILMPFLKTARDETKQQRLE